MKGDEIFMDVLLFDRIPKSVVDRWLDILKGVLDERVARNIVFEILGDPSVRVGPKDELIDNVRKVLDEIDLKKLGDMSVDLENEIKEKILDELESKIREMLGGLSSVREEIPVLASPLTDLFDPLILSLEEYVRELKKLAKIDDPKSKAKVKEILTNIRSLVDDTIENLQ